MGIAVVIERHESEWSVVEALLFKHADQRLDVLEEVRLEG
jgi:hypothetical protein